MINLRILRFLRRHVDIILFVLAIGGAAVYFMDPPSPEPERPARIGVLSYFEETGSQKTLQQLLTLFFDQDPSLDLLYRVTKADPAAQSAQLTGLVQQNCQVVILNRGDFSRDDKAVLAAAADGVRLLAVNAYVPASHAYLGTNPYDEGYTLGNHLRQTLPHQAALIYLGGSEELFAKQQLLGFSQACILLRPDVRFIAPKLTRQTAAEAKRAVTELLAKRPDLQDLAIVAPSLELALAARQAVEASHRPAPLTYCISSEPAADDALLNGTLQAAVGVNLDDAARDACQMARELARGQRVSNKLYIPRLRLAENVKR